MKKAIQNKSKVIWEVIDEKLNKSELLSFNHSQHSLERAYQRNINNQNIAVAIEYGKGFFKQGMIFYVLGENSLPKNIKCNQKTKNLVVVVAGNSNTIITCYRAKNPFKHVKKKQRNLVASYGNVA